MDVYFPKNINYCTKIFLCACVNLFRCPTGRINFFDRVPCFCFCHDAIIFFPFIISGKYIVPYRYSFTVPYDSRTYVSKINGKNFVKPVRYGLATVQCATINRDFVLF